MVSAKRCWVRGKALTQFGKAGRTPSTKHITHDYYLSSYSLFDNCNMDTILMQIYAAVFAICCTVSWHYVMECHATICCCCCVIRREITGIALDETIREKQIIYGYIVRVSIKHWTEYKSRTYYSTACNYLFSSSPTLFRRASQSRPRFLDFPLGFIAISAYSFLVFIL